MCFVVVVVIYPLYELETCLVFFCRLEQEKVGSGAGRGEWEKNGKKAEGLEGGE